jgi:hypothetical protein
MEYIVLEKATSIRLRDWILYVIAFVAGLAWTVSLWLRSPGTSVQDEIGHFLLARNAWNYPILALDIWGRVFNTLLYMVPSLFGLNGARLASVLMSCATVLLTTRVARVFGVRHLFLVPLFLWFQYWGADLMYAASTTVPFTLFLIFAVHEWVERRFETASIAIGLLPLIRHEGIALLGVWCLYLVLRREWRAVLVTATPTILYNAVYLVALHPPLRMLPVSVYFNPTSYQDYGKGSWFHYVPLTMHGVGMAIGLWVVIGLVPAWRLRRQMFYFVPYAVYFLVHTIIYHYGAYASGGYYLFISPTAPAFAIIAALGAEALLAPALAASERLTSIWGKRLAIAGSAVLLIVPVLYKAATSQVPRQFIVEEESVWEAARWLRTQPVSPSAVESTHVFFYYFYQLPWTPERPWWKPTPVEKMPPGTIAVWDQKYSDLAGMRRDGFREDRGWRKVAQFGSGQVEVYQRQVTPNADEAVAVPRS